MLRLVFGRGRLEDDVLALHTADTPQRPSTPNEDTERELGARPAKLDVAVGEAEPQDRLFVGAVVIPHQDCSVRLEARPEQGPAPRALAAVLRPYVSRLDSEDDRPGPRRLRDSPELALATDRVADSRRSVLPRGIDLEVAVRVEDLESSTGHEHLAVWGVQGMPAPDLLETPANDRFRDGSDEAADASELREPFALAALVLPASVSARKLLARFGARFHDYHPVVVLRLRDVGDRPGHPLLGSACRRRRERGPSSHTPTNRTGSEL